MKEYTIDDLERLTDQWAEQAEQQALYTPWGGARAFLDWLRDQAVLDALGETE